MLYGEQIRAARSLLGWSQADLAREANIGEMTIKRFEAKHGLVGGTVHSLVRVKTALELAGIVFIEPDETGGVGVRLSRKM